jgi:hypothetical protein
MRFAVIGAAVVVEPRRFHGAIIAHFPSTLVRNESRRTASPKKVLDLERVAKLVQDEVSQNGILYSGRS